MGRTWIGHTPRSGSRLDGGFNCSRTLVCGSYLSSCRRCEFFSFVLSDTPLFHPLLFLSLPLYLAFGLNDKTPRFVVCDHRDVWENVWELWLTNRVQWRPLTNAFAWHMESSMPCRCEGARRVMRCISCVIISLNLSQSSRSLQLNTRGFYIRLGDEFFHRNQITCAHRDPRKSFDVAVRFTIVVFYGSITRLYIELLRHETMMYVR